MNSKLWIRQALSLCLVVTTIATYSMVALAGSKKIAGEILVSGKNVNGESPFITVNGEAAQSGHSIFSTSTIATPENAETIVNLGKIGKIELAPNTILVLSFNEKGINGDLLAGRVTVLNAADIVNIKTVNGLISKLNVGESAVATTGKVQDDDDDDDDDGGIIWWALVLGGAAAGIIIAAATNNNRVSLGGGGTIITPSR